ncbi:hypothetical protein TOPH_07948 [Tolypocladium ophioglossoides CBS 100239]|uniref:Uncharacterized protein n=1 Tax=Tolypocladium ophioglossoides (strain CBS 100239) TaxID=1163406 RepID=A0A0L0N093_TOLOC|nr:hypothetical protein TOPH_07948 [Tolypocladium ophioglossoides CBS 100239]
MTTGGLVHSIPALAAPASPGPVRVAVRCISHKIPGPPRERVTTMGNLIYQYHWGRDMDQEMDFIQTTGLPHLDVEKVYFLLDSAVLSGAKLDEDAIPILAYRWNGKTLKKRKIGTHLRNYIGTFPFKQERTIASTSTPGKTTAERRDEMSEAELDEHMRYIVFQKIKYRRNVSRQEREWLAGHPEQFDGIMREHIARRRWHGVPLWDSQELWLREHDGDASLETSSNLDLMDRVLQQHQLEIHQEGSYGRKS